MQRYLVPPLLWLAACAGKAPEDPSTRIASGDEPEPALVELDDGVSFDGSGRRIRSDRDDAAAPTPDAPSRWDTQAITPHEPTAAAPARVGRRDIQLHHARLDNALRLIAREGRFNLVVQDELTQPISVDLRQVEPYEALLAIAQAHGIAVRYQGNIVIVGTPAR